MSLEITRGHKETEELTEMLVNIRESTLSSVRSF